MTTTNKHKWYGDKHKGKQLFIKDNLHRIDFADELDGKEMPIEMFCGDTKWLSNFYPCTIIYSCTPNSEPKTFISTEHAYQACKTLDPVWQDEIRDAPTPYIAKQKGNICPIRPDWDEIKDGIMLDVLRIKFNDPQLQDMLLSTHPRYLIEGNIWHDNHFGVCLLENCEKCKDVKGLNILGKLLMQVREEILITGLKNEIKFPQTKASREKLSQAFKQQAESTMKSILGCDIKW